MKFFIKKNRAEKAFSMSEVLITVAIVGIISVLTIPVFISAVAEKKQVTSMLIAYSLLKSATKDILLENSGSMAYAASTTTELRNAYCSHLNCLKTCDTGSCENIAYSSSVNNLLGIAYTPALSGSGAVLSNGMAILIVSVDTECDDSRYQYNGANAACGQIIVDINGTEFPNIVGRDIFEFIPYEFGLVPYGTEDSDINWKDGDSCSVSASSGDFRGAGCAARIIEQGNMMDY